MGEAMAGKAMGKRALLIGAVAQSLPDIDFVAGFWMDADDNLLAHRGFTHSILFMLIISALAAFVMERSYRSRGMSLKGWGTFFCVEMGVHLLLDLMNVYGVGLFEPFSHERISFNVLFVADPFFSVVPGLAVVALLAVRQPSVGRKRWTLAGLTIPALYLMIAVTIKLHVSSLVRMEIAKRGLSTDRYFVTPTMMNVLLWYAVVQDGERFHIGYRSVLDKMPMEWHVHNQHKELIDPISGREDVQNLKRFSRGYFAVKQVEGRPVLSDLRFGQVFGWNNPAAPFVFNYDLGNKGDNALIIQRGRFTEWTLINLRLTLHRIAGR
jgi:inner membrane protein